MTIYAYVPDLMDKSRFGSIKAEMIFVSEPEHLSRAAVTDVAIADLSRSGALAALTGLNGPRRVGFISHIDEEGIAAAKKSGIEVFPRSRFFSRIVEICTQGND